VQRTHTRAGLTRASPLQCLPEFEIRRADHSENSLLRMAAHAELARIPKCKQRSLYTESSPRCRRQLRQRMRLEPLFSMS
jgi:hypothetical protein